MNRLRRFMLNGILMAAVTLLMRSVAVGFNVYISNRIGAVAMGLFGLISTVYGFGITLATSGINLAATRLIAKAQSEDDENLRSRRTLCILRRCLLYSLVFGSIATISLYFFADNIGVGILKDERTVRSLRILALTLLPISLTSALSGYFSAVRRVYKNACVQILGQGIRIYACILLLSLIGARDTESACLCVVWGGAVAELIAFVISAVLFIMEKPSKKSKPSSEERSAASSELVRNALPLALSAYMRSALVTIEHILIPIGLEKSGSSRDTSLAAYGTVSSMVFPLVLFPSAISAAFSGLLIPEIAESCASGDERRIKGITSSVLEAVLIFSIGCAGILTCFALELGSRVYPESLTAGKYVLMIAPLIPVMYLDTAVDSLLKGLGEQVYCMWVNIADASVSVLLVAILLPRMGINGYIATVYFTEILNAALSITRLLIKSGIRTHVILWVARPLVCVVASTHLTRLILNSFAPFLNIWWRITVSAILYVALNVLSGGIKPKRIIKSLKYAVSIK